MPNYGIDGLKKALDGVFRLATTLEKSLEDGKINIIEGAQLAVASVRFWNAVKDVKTIKQEFLDLNQDEKADLIEYFRAEFDLKNDDLEATIEELFEAMLHIAASIFALRK